MSNNYYDDNELYEHFRADAQQLNFQPDDYNEDITDIETEYSDEITDVPVKKKHWARRLIVFTIVFCILIVFVNVGLLFFTGKIWFNQPEKIDYPFRGAFVDSELGTIDWKTFASQNISLAYIKATEGTGTKDEKFDKSWNDSQECDLMVGAYHVFSLKKNGQTQAEYFCSAMGESISGRLIPAVDVRLSGFYSIIPPDKDDVIRNLKVFCKYIHDQYGVYPMIICNERSYDKYLSEAFKNFPICIVSNFSEPDESINWYFWSYNPRVRLKGYENKKEYFSMFVFGRAVSRESFENRFLCP